MAAVSEEEPDHGIQLSSFTALLTSRRIPKVGHMCAGQLRVHATCDSRGNSAHDTARPQREARRQASLRPRRDCNLKLARWGRASTGAGWSRSCSTANGVQVVTVMPRTLAPPATLNPGALSPPKQLILQNTGGSGRPPPGKIGLPGAQGAGNGGIGPRAQLGRSP